MVKNVGPVPVPPGPAPASGVRRMLTPGFGEVLRREIGAAEIKFSAHAERRLAERRISFSPDDLERINRAASLAAAKGSRRSLLICGDLALVTSIANRTVITAVNGPAADNVFTDIDSAVIVK